MRCGSISLSLAVLIWGIFAASLIVPQGLVKGVEKLESYLLVGKRRGN